MSVREGAVLQRDGPWSPRPVRHRVLQRKCACGGSGPGEEECAECREKEEGRVYRAEKDHSPVSEVPAIVHEVLREPGEPLDSATRAFMEPRFGHDFSGVRVHTDAKAAESARAANAHAYTVGQHVVFGGGLYAPSTTEGRRLLGHELTHTIQQEGEIASNWGRTFALSPACSESQEPEEREASAAAERIAKMEDGGFISPRTKPQLQRSPAPGGTAPSTRGLPERVKFWIKAFIPNSIDGGKPVPKGPLQGQTMFDGPFPWSDCFLTDNRGFSADVRASARMHIEAEVATTPRELSFSGAWSFPTREVDCEDGDIECNRRPTPRALVTLVPNWPPYQEDPDLIQLPVTGAANDPCFAGSPDVDVDGMVRIDPRTRMLRFDGSTDPFPAFEMYAAVNNGPGRTVFTYMPPPGTSAWSLWGGANLAQSGTVGLD